jgi:hypothetical protein
MEGVGISRNRKNYFIGAKEMRESDKRILIGIV